MKTQTNDSDRAGVLQRFLDSVIMTLGSVLVFVFGIFCVLILTVSAAIMAPFAAYQLGRLRRKIMPASEFEHSENDPGRDPVVIDGQYTLLER